MLDEKLRDSNTHPDTLERSRSDSPTVLMDVDKGVWRGAGRAALKAAIKAVTG